MRLIQCTTLYEGYLRRLDVLARQANNYAERQSIFLADRHGAAHFLKPVLEQDATAFQANVNDAVHQRMWAKENGLPEKSSLIEILLAQVEHHRAEVFYSMDPVALPSSFVRRLPGCVKKTIGWRAAPTKGADFTAYDLIVSNFPKLLQEYETEGCRVAAFYPAHDPDQDRYAANDERPIDVLFVGSYSRNHSIRNRLLEEVVSIGYTYKIELHLETSGITKLMEHRPLRWIPGLPYKLPSKLRVNAKGPVYGVELYEVLSQAKIVLNCSIDNAGVERGNIRCFEAMGCGCVLLSDEGIYPKEIKPNYNMVTYRNNGDAVKKMEQLLTDQALLREMSINAHSSISNYYSKEKQLQDFYNLIS